MREKPVVESVEVTFHYPAYLGRKDETVQPEGPGPRSARSTPWPSCGCGPRRRVAKGYLESEGERFAGRVEEGGKLLVASMPLLKDGSYSVRLFDDAGHTDPDPRLNRITVLPDRPPTVELLKPARQSSAAPGGDVPVTIRAGDDHGIGRLRLEMKVAAARGGSRRRRPNAKPAAGRASRPRSSSSGPTSPATRSPPPCGITRLELKPEVVKPGQTVLVRAVAWDKRAISDWGLDLKPQEGASGWHAIKIVAEDAKSAAALEQLDEPARGDLEDSGEADRAPARPPARC